MAWQSMVGHRRACNAELAEGHSPHSWSPSSEMSSPPPARSLSLFHKQGPLCGSFMQQPPPPPLPLLPCYLSPSIPYSPPPVLLLDSILLLLLLSSVPDVSLPKNKKSAPTPSSQLDGSFHRARCTQLIPHLLLHPFISKVYPKK